MRVDDGGFEVTGQFEWRTRRETASLAMGLVGVLPAKTMFNASQKCNLAIGVGVDIDIRFECITC